jgi:hypothetical protein
VERRERDGMKLSLAEEVRVTKSTGGMDVTVGGGEASEEAEYGVEVDVGCDGSVESS